MRHLKPVLVLASAAISSAAGDTARPRGVGPECKIPHLLSRQHRPIGGILDTSS
jgi:hypothetical protein